MSLITNLLAPFSSFASKKVLQLLTPAHLLMSWLWVLYKPSLYLTTFKSSLITVLSNQGHICMFFSSIPFLSSWRVMHIGAIHQNHGGHLLLWAQGHLSPPQISDAELFSKFLLSPTSPFKDKYCYNLSYAEDNKRPPKASTFGDFLGQGKPKQEGRGGGKGCGQGKSYRYAIVLRTVENDQGGPVCSWRANSVQAILLWLN